MSLDFLFFIVWVLFIIFAGNKAALNKTKKIIRSMQDSQRQQSSPSRSARKKTNPWGEQTADEYSAPAETTGRTVSQRETQRMLDALGGHDDLKPDHQSHERTVLRDELERDVFTQPKLRRKNPLKKLSIEETLSHKADLEPELEGLIHLESPTEEQGAQRSPLMGNNSVRQAFIFKELLDKPVSMRD